MGATMKAMRFRAIVLALALAAGLSTAMEAKSKPQTLYNPGKPPKNKGPKYKGPQYKAPKYKAKKYKAPKYKRSGRA